MVISSVCYHNENECNCHLMTRFEMRYDARKKSYIEKFVVTSFPVLLKL